MSWFKSWTDATFILSLPHAALITAPPCECCLQFHSLKSCCTAAMGSSQSGIAPKLHWRQLSAICHFEQSGPIMDLLARCYLFIPWWQMACAQLYKYHHQRGELQASLKATLFYKLTFIDIFRIPSASFWAKLVIFSCKQGVNTNRQLYKHQIITVVCNHIFWCAIKG